MRSPAKLWAILFVIPIFAAEWLALWNNPVLSRLGVVLVGITFSGFVLGLGFLSWCFHSASSSAKRSTVIVWWHRLGIIAHGRVAPFMWLAAAVAFAAEAETLNIVAAAFCAVIIPVEIVGAHYHRTMISPPAGPAGDTSP